jgi:hypothetical protein
VLSAVGDAKISSQATKPEIWFNCNLSGTLGAVQITYFGSVAQLSKEAPAYLLKLSFNRFLCYSFQF